MKILKPNLQIAIDGPVASGKGTTSKLLANKLGILYIDTGAMYRALTYFVKQNKISCDDDVKICKLLKDKQPQILLQAPIKNKKDGRLITVLLNNQDVSWKIRAEHVSRCVPITASFECVRNYLTPMQQKIASLNSVIMEGRDITTVVLPQADLKIYLDASLDKRAYRRYRQLADRGEDNINQEKIKLDIVARDQNDEQKKIGALKISDDAWVLDTTNLTIIETVDIIIKKLSEKQLIQI